MIWSVKYYFEPIVDSISEENVLLFIFNANDEKYHKYNSHLTFVDHIIRDGKKNTYHIKHNLNCCIENIKIPYEYIPYYHLINRIILIQIYYSNVYCDC